MNQSTLSGWVQAVSMACDAQAAMRTATQIARFHRIQASSGYHDAAVCVAELLRDAGLEPQLLTYPADGKTTYFTQKTFRQWVCRGAWLRLTAPWQECAADFHLEEMSLIQRSAPLDKSGEDVPIVYVHDGITPENFTEDIRDKLLFVKNGFERWTEVAAEQGAAGILTVSMPEIPPVRVRPWEDSQLQDSHANLSFHHYTRKSEETLRGFAVSPRFGKKLEEACIALGQEGKYPTARFCIDTEFQDGFIENVTAVIEGSTEEEVLLTAHLCHPRSSVNDNASGAACAIEVMRTLKRMIDSGTLEKPTRSIRLLLLPEFTGTYCWLGENLSRLHKVVAGFNMDLVAGRMDGRAGPLVIVDTPDAAHSFAGDLCEAILAQMQKDCTFGGAGRYVPLLFALRVPFALGSDHYILSDPTIGIPTVALTQWPDKTYHTSADDLSHLDPWLMEKDVVWAATYSLAFANLSLEVMQEVLPYTENRLFARINALRRAVTLSPQERKRQGCYLSELAANTLAQYTALLPEQEQPDGIAIVQEELRALRLLIPEGAADLDSAERDVPDSPIPRRLFRAPLVMRCIRATMTAQQCAAFDALEKQYPGGSEWMDQILYEMDGHRTVDEIAWRVHCATGADCRAYAADLVACLCQLGLVTIENTPQGTA